MLINSKQGKLFSKEIIYTVQIFSFNYKRTKYDIDELKFCRFVTLSDKYFIADETHYDNFT